MSLNPFHHLVLKNLQHFPPTVMFQGEQILHTIIRAVCHHRNEFKFKSAPNYFHLIHSPVQLVRLPKVLHQLAALERRQRHQVPTLGRLVARDLLRPDPFDFQIRLERIAARNQARSAVDQGSQPVEGVHGVGSLARLIITEQSGLWKRRRN